MLAKHHNILGSSSPRVLYIVVEAKKIALNQQCHINSFYFIKWVIYLIHSPKRYRCNSSFFRNCINVCCRKYSLVIGIPFIASKTFSPSKKTVDFVRNLYYIFRCYLFIVDGINNTAPQIKRILNRIMEGKCLLP